MEDYIARSLSKFEYYNSPNGIGLPRLEQIIEVASLQ